MTKNIKRRPKPKQIYILLLIVIILIITTIIYFLMDEPDHEIEISHTSGYYLFDPDTVFELLSEDNQETFEPTDSIANSADKTLTNDIQWNEDDYMRIMQSFHSFHWQDKVEDGWNLLRIEFQTTCEDVNNSLQSGDYYLFRINSSPKGRTRQIHRIVIKPLEGTIWWSESELSPIIEQWVPVDLKNLKFFATDALSIAEINGGKATRLNIGNDCVTVITENHDEWRVAYFSPTFNKTVIEFFINSSTGKYRIENHE